MTFLDERLPERFWSKCTPEPNSGCWIWIACTTDEGYGQVGFGRRVLHAHRVAYETLVGTIPDGLELDHRCRNTACCNPRHLEPVTHAENCRRGDAGSVRRALCAAVTHCPKGHAYTPDNTRLRPHPLGYRTRVCKECNRLRCAAGRSKS